MNGPKLYLSAFGGIKFFAVGSPKAILDINGSFGIGTMTPQAKLEVTANSNLGSTGIFHSTGGQAWGNVVTLVTDSPSGDEPRLLLATVIKPSSGLLVGITIATGLAYGRMLATVLLAPVGAQKG
jgi:hypothetical protein